MTAHLSKLKLILNPGVVWICTLIILSYNSTLQAQWYQVITKIDSESKDDKPVSNCPEIIKTVVTGENSPMFDLAVSEIDNFGALAMSISHEKTVTDGGGNASVPPFRIRSNRSRLFAGKPREREPDGSLLAPPALALEDSPFHSPHAVV